MSQLTTQYTYDAGDVHLLPQDAIPTLFTKSYTASATTGTNCYDTYTQVDRYIDYIPFSTDIEKNYSDGCTSIIYPAVEVAQVNSVGKKVRGSIKSSFWTNSDLVLPGTPSVSINKILTNVNFIPVIQVWDRSGIVGMAKKVEYLDNNGSTVYSKENTYAFSETVAGIAGVVFGDLSTLVGDNTPLGMIRQRSKELDASGNVDTITDLIISKPFLVETHEVKDNVAIINTFYGLFDAFTGNPTATLTTNGNQDKKLTISVPYNYMITSRENEDLTEKNMYTLPGGSIVVDATNMPITKLADISFGTFSSSMDKIKCGTAQTYQVENVTTDAIFPQFRFSKLAAFTMTDFTDDQTSLQWPTMGGTNWLNKSQIAMVDKFSRPLTEVVPMEGPATAIYHPRMNAVCGLVKNAEYYECGVLTCDYDEQNSLFPGDFDHENGWENGGATVVSGGHFGKKCVHIVNAFGPTHNFKVSSSKNYILSVNAKVNSGSLFLWAEYRDKAGPYEISAWPIPDGDLTPPLKDPKNLSNDLSDYLMVSLSDAQDWKKFELLISTSTKLPRSTGYIRVWIGNGNGNVDALVDDIRFFPADAHVSSFYYDQNLAQPIAFVDENGKMKGFEYDVFGRLKAIKNNAGQTLKTATYSSGDPSTVTGAIRITKPVNGAALVRSNGTLPIQWATYGIVGNVTLKYSVDNKATWTTIAGSQANSGSYTWLLPSGLAATADVWIRVEESLKSDLVFDETGASFRIVNYAARNRSFVSQFIMDLIGNAGGD
jgi:YD repeat-containing protein